MTISVIVINGRDKPISHLRVEPKVLPGKFLGFGNSVEDSTIDARQLEVLSILREMESQAIRAYEKQRIRKMSLSDKVIYNYLEMLNFYVGIFGKKQRLLIPPWAKETFRIQGLKDVERLQREVIEHEPEESFLRTAWRIDRERLEGLLSTRPKEEEPTEIVLQPGESLSFPFLVRAPTLLRSRSLETQFRISYQMADEPRRMFTSKSATVSIIPSPFAIPTGGLIGGVLGYAIRVLALRPPTTPLPLTATLVQVLIAGALGLLLALLTRRSPSTYKPFTVEDFLGSFVVGAIGALFSDTALAKLQALAS